jgi:hypothetical protein
VFIDVDAKGKDGDGAANPDENDVPTDGIQRHKESWKDATRERKKLFRDVDVLKLS